MLRLGNGWERLLVRGRHGGIVLSVEWQFDIMVGLFALAAVAVAVAQQTLP